MICQHCSTKIKDSDITVSIVEHDTERLDIQAHCPECSEMQYQFAEVSDFIHKNTPMKKAENH